MPGDDAPDEPKRHESDEPDGTPGVDVEPSSTAAAEPDIETEPQSTSASPDAETHDAPDAERHKTSDAVAHETLPPTVNGVAPPQIETNVDAAPDDSADQRTFGLSRGDLIFVSAMLLVILSLSVIQLVHRFGWRAREIEVLHAADDYRFTIDINTATWVEWLQLDGIGETLARRIVEHRERHGAFQSIEELDDVRGIGPGTLAKIRPYLRCSEPVATETGD